MPIPGTARRGSSTEPWIPASKLIKPLEMLGIYARIFLYAVEELQNVRYGLMPFEDSSKGLKEDLATELKSVLEYLSKCSVPGWTGCDKVLVGRPLIRGCHRNERR